MPQLCWYVSAHGEYWIDVSLAGRPFKVLVDTGLINVAGKVGFSIDEFQYDAMKNSGCFGRHLNHTRLMANGQIARSESGSLRAQLICPQTGVGMGPVVEVFAYRGVAGVPNRVGLTFFHLLKGCKVLWDLDQRSWCIKVS